MVAHCEIGQIEAVDRPEDSLEPGLVGLIQKMGPVHHDTHVVGDSGIAPPEEFLGRVSLAAGDRNHFSAFPEP